MSPIFGGSLRKMTCNLRHPSGLRHTVHAHLYNRDTLTLSRSLARLLRFAFFLSPPPPLLSLSVYLCLPPPPSFSRSRSCLLCLSLPHTYQTEMRLQTSKIPNSETCAHLPCFCTLFFGVWLLFRAGPSVLDLSVSLWFYFRYYVYVCMCMYIHADIYVCMYMYTHVYVYMYVYHTRTWTWASRCDSISGMMCVCVYMYIYKCIYM